MRASYPDPALVQACHRRSRSRLTFVREASTTSDDVLREGSRAQSLTSMYLPTLVRRDYDSARLWRSSQLVHLEVLDLPRLVSGIERDSGEPDLPARTFDLAATTSSDYLGFLRYSDF